MAERFLHSVSLKEIELFLYQKKCTHAMLLLSPFLVRKISYQISPRIAWSRTVCWVCMFSSYSLVCMNEALILGPVHFSYHCNAFQRLLISIQIVLVLEEFHFFSIFCQHGPLVNMFSLWDSLLLDQTARLVLLPIKVEGNGNSMPPPHGKAHEQHTLEILIEMLHATENVYIVHCSKREDNFQSHCTVCPWNKILAG